MENRKESYWNEDFGEYFGEYVDAINNMVDCYIGEKKLDKITVLVPQIATDWEKVLSNRLDVELVYYNITKTFEPEWKSIREQKMEGDIFVFVHWFGTPRNINDARVYCTQKNMLLIEDCSHILYKEQGVGKKGDFILYRPGQFLKTEDGAVVGSNKSKDITVQNIINRFTSKNESVKSSNFRKSLEDYTYKNLKEIADLRKYNTLVVNEIVSQFEMKFEIVSTGADGEVPLYATYILKGEVDKNKFIEQAKVADLNVIGVKELGTGEADGVQQFVVLLDVNQEIKTQVIAKKVKFNNNPDKLTIEWINDEDAIDTYRAVYNNSILANIPQEWNYGEIKERIEGWNIKRALIKNDKNEDVGVLQLLIKKICGITVALRINRGPLFNEEYNSAINHIEIVNRIKKEFGMFKPMFWAPDFDRTGENIALLSQNGWIMRDSNGYGSGVIDLTNTIEDIRKNIDSKWRNQLVSAEKKEVTIKTDFDRFEEMLDIYEENQKEKNYLGIPRNILIAMKNNPYSPLRLKYIEEDGDIVAFDMFYVENNFGLYLVGWNNNRGRKLYANNILLYNEVVDLKNAGVKWFDLGGIDYINTEENAKFKDGFNPIHYRRVGEFVKIL